jgi:hypothetical protein
VLSVLCNSSRHGNNNLLKNNLFFTFCFRGYCFSVLEIYPEGLPGTQEFTKVSRVFWLCRNPRFPVTCKSSSVYRRVTPSLPQRGRHPKGSIPLTPGSSRRPYEVIAIWGMPERRGRKHEVREPPRATPQFLARISTEPKIPLFNKKILIFLQELFR